MIQRRWGLEGVCLGVLVAVGAWAQAAPRAVHDVADLSLDDLLNMPVAVASATKAQSLRETPGVVTVITRDEIISSGARDLIDVLLLVPGFSFPGVDVENVVDFGFRGLWAHEGKILILMDGQPLNDLFYGNNALGLHYPVEQIQSLEVIRGPGSVVYGGSAELAVINLITRTAADLHGASAAVHYGQLPSAMGEATVNVAAGLQNIAGIDGLEATAFAYVGRGNRSDATYSDFGSSANPGVPNTFPMAGNESTNPNFFNVGLKYRDFHARFILDDYQLTERDSYVTDNFQTQAPPSIATGPARESWTTLVADAEYELHLGKLTLTPRFNFKHQTVFQNPDQYSFDYSDHIAERFMTRLTGAYELTDELSAVAGGEWYVDRAWEETQFPYYGPNFLITYDSKVPSGSFWAHYWNLAAFAEVQYHGAFGNLTVGARYEHNNSFGDSFVPRAVYTKVFGKFHAKALYSFAFRAPQIGDIALGSPNGNTARTGPITPEHTRSAEIEVGYEFDSHNLVTLNLFDITLFDPLAFNFDQVTNTYYYFNFFKTGSQGLELEYRLKYGWGYLKANYSFYTAWNPFLNQSKNTVDFYVVPDNTLLAGFPAHKVTVSGKVALWRNLYLSPSVMFFSQIEGQTAPDAAVDGNGAVGTVPALFLLNAFVGYNDLGIKGLELGVGVSNALNTGYAYLQPYQSSHPPLPGPRRDFGIRLAYTPP